MNQIGSQNHHTHTPPTGDAELNRAVANLQENEVPPPPEIEVTQKDREMWEKKASPEVIVQLPTPITPCSSFGI